MYYDFTITQIKNIDYFDIHHKCTGSILHEATVKRVSRRKAMLATGRGERTAMIDLENGKNSIVGMGGYSAAPTNERTRP